MIPSMKSLKCEFFVNSLNWPSVPKSQFLLDVFTYVYYICIHLGMCIYLTGANCPKILLL